MEIQRLSCGTSISLVQFSSSDPLGDFGCLDISIPTLELHRFMLGPC